MEDVCHLHGLWHCTGDFSLSGSCQNRYVAAFCRPRVLVVVNRVYQGIALVDEGYVPGFEVWDFEWENNEEFVDPCLEFAVAVFA